MQVLIKPSPEDSQELYIKSLEKVGIDWDLNDIKFVEDDWESPTLGAAGLDGRFSVMEWKLVNLHISSKWVQLIVTQ